jgi:hypothetical protein
MDDSGIFAWGPAADSEGSENAGLSRRQFISSVVVAGAAIGLAGTAAEAAFTKTPAQAATPPGGPPTTTVPLPTTTAPEQLWLTWGKNPARDVTITWLSPGSVPQPAPTLTYSTSPLSSSNPGRTIQLPQPQPLDVTPLPRSASG